MKRYESKYVVCPFYHNEGSVTLYCEGVVKDSTLLNEFTKIADKQKYKQEYCCSLANHKNCPMAKFLYEKYK